MSQEQVSGAATPPVNSRVAEAQEGICQVCERDYPVWFAPNPIWNAAIRRDGVDEWNYLCPSCFASIASERSVHSGAWCLTSDVHGHEQAAALAYALREIVIQGTAALSEYRDGAVAFTSGVGPDRAEAAPESDSPGGTR